PSIAYAIADTTPGCSPHLTLRQSAISLDVQVSLGRPRGAGDVSEPGRGEVKRRLPVGERAYDARAPSDLAQDALERIVGADAPPVLLREGVVGECLLDRFLDELGSPSQPQRPQLLDHSDGLLACRRDVLAGVDRLEHRGDLPHLGPGHVAEDVAVPV